MKTKEEIEKRLEAFKKDVIPGDTTKPGLMIIAAIEVLKWVLDDNTKS